MSDTDIFDPEPCIVIKFSQFPPQSRNVLLTYSTDTEKTNPKKAKEQARILAEVHFENIPKHLRKHRVVKRKWLFWKSKISAARCALMEHGISIRDIGIVGNSEQGDGIDLQCLTSVSAIDWPILMIEMLRFPESSLQNAEQKEGEWQFRFRSQIGFAQWQASVGGFQYSGVTTTTPRRDL